jgi:tetratricopeptide (TPR) repeat protein
MITLCVAYMVKNESNNIEFSLNSVRTIADKIIVVDTGSTDDTIKKIQNWCDINKIEVKIYERPFVNFGYNRSELAVLTHNEATYTLFLDADMLVELNNFNKQELKADQYDLLIHWVGTGFYNPLLVSNKLSWHSIGVIHEYWYAEHIKSRDKLPSLILNHDRHGPARPKGLNDLKLLEQGVIDEPNNARYHFYLANTLRDVGKYEEAIKIFSKRIEMGGWVEEIFYSKYQIGYCFELLNELNKAKIAYLKAWEYRPSRAEPLYKLATICRKNGEYQQSYLFAEKGLEIPYPNDIIFVDKPTYEYGLLFELSIAAYWVGHYKKAIKLCKKLNKIQNIPEDVKIQNLKNIKFSEDKI